MQYSEDFLRSGGNSVFGNALYRKRGSRRYEEVSDAMGAENYWPWGLSVGDLNADGYEDVFLTSSMNYPFRYGVNSLLINNAGEEFLDAESSWVSNRAATTSRPRRGSAWTATGRTRNTSTARG